MAKRFALLISILTPKRRWAQFRLKTLFVLLVITPLPPESIEDDPEQ